MSNKAVDILSETPGIESADFDRMLMEFNVSGEGQEIPAEEEAAAQPAATAEPETETTPEPHFTDWDDLLPDDPRLPPTYRAQKRVRDLWEERVDLTHKRDRLGQLLNEKDAEIRTLRSTLETLGRQPAQPPAPEPAPSKPSLTKRTGVDYNEALITDANDALERYGQAVIQQAVDDAVARVRQEFEPLIKPLQTNLEAMTAQRHVTEMMEAAEKARLALEVPPDQWAAREMDMKVAIYQNAPSIDAFKDPRFWYAAYQDVAARWNLVPPTTEPSTPAPAGSPPQRRGPGSNTRPAQGQGRVSRVTPGMRAAAAEIAPAFGMKLEDLIDDEQ